MASTPAPLDPRASLLERTSRAPLRTIVTWITALVVGVALLVAAALVFLTSSLRWTNSTLAATVESVRLAEEIEIDLLLHSRTSDPLVREDIAGNLRRKLEEASHSVTTPTEAVVLHRADARVDEYLQSSWDEDPSHEDAREQRRIAAYAAVQELVDDNVAQAQAAQEEARRVDALADAIALGAAILLVLVATSLLWWLRARAFRPLWHLARAMEAFGAGDYKARADELGPAELREVALRFNQMASALAAQRRAQLTFLGGVAHDLRNPLCALRLAVSTLDRDAPPPDPRTRTTLESISRQTTYLERMVGDFLDVARLEAGELELRLAVTDLRALAREVGELFEGWSPRHRIVLDLPEAVVPVRVDALRIEQAITNLVSNAIKYSPEGGDIDVVVSAGAGEAAISVRDRGVGMRPVDQLKIFEAFTRVGLSRESVPGAGLGLYIVQKIVQAHGGEVDVESAVGRGSTLHMRLPLHTG